MPRTFAGATLVTVLLFSLASFILALLSGSPLPEQEGHEMTGEDGGRWSRVCQVEAAVDVPEDDLKDSVLS